MFRTTDRRRRPRRGAILMVVLGMLTLMAIVGLTFVLRAESEATAARTYREAHVEGEARPTAYALEYANHALGQFVFTAPDGTQSGLYGYELGRTMYGMGNDRLSMYSGQGRWTIADFPPPPPTGTNTNQDYMTLPITTGSPPITITIRRSDVVHYARQPGTPYVLEPEYQWWRDPNAPGNPNPYPPGPGFPTGAGAPQYRSLSAPYTYPDLKDLYLAVINPTDGAVLQPSMYRTFSSFRATAVNAASLATGLEWAGSFPTVNQNWANAVGRLMIVRPRPADQLTPAELASLPSFGGSTTLPPTTLTPQQWGEINAKVDEVGALSYPPANPDGTVTGDVQNIRHPNGLQRNDALWVYTGAPVRMWNNKAYTALVAMTVLDLNGRVNLSEAGNRMGYGFTHASGPGVGRWEINPARVFELLPPVPTAPGAPLYDSSPDRAMRQLLGDPTSTIPPGPGPWSQPYQQFAGPNGGVPVGGNCGSGPCGSVAVACLLPATDRSTRPLRSMIVGATIATYVLPFHVSTGPPG